jgi:hypothetical protein
MRARMQASAGLCWRAVAVVSSVEVDDFDGLSPASQRELSTKMDDDERLGRASDAEQHRQAQH